MYELKYDGFRLLAFGGAGRAELRYRSGQEVTARYPEIASVVRALPIAGLVHRWRGRRARRRRPPAIPGARRARAALARQRDRTRRARQAGHLRRVRPRSPLPATICARARWSSARTLLAPPAPRARSDPVLRSRRGPRRSLARRGRRARTRRRGREEESVALPHTRSHDWLKLKLDPEADFAVCGWTPPKGSRARARRVAPVRLARRALAVRRQGRLRLRRRRARRARTRELARSRRGSRRSRAPRAAATRAGSSPSSSCRCAIASGPPSTLRFPVFVRMRRDKPAARLRDAEPHDRRAPARDAHGDRAAASRPTTLPHARAAPDAAQEDPWPDDGDHQGRAGRLLPRDRAVDVAVPARPPDGAHALPRRHHRRDVLPEGHARLDRRRGCARPRCGASTASARSTTS